MPNTVIVAVAALFLIFQKGLKKVMNIKIISNGYKYQCNQSKKHNSSCYIEHLLCFVMTPFNQRSLRTGIKKLNRDNGTQALIDDRSLIKFFQTSQIRQQLPFKYRMGTIPEKTQSLEYPSNSNSKPILLSTISLNAEFSQCSALAPIIQNNSSTMLIGNFSPVDRFKHEETGVINDNKN